MVELEPLVNVYRTLENQHVQWKKLTNYAFAQVRLLVLGSDVGSTIRDGLAKPGSSPKFAAGVVASAAFKSCTVSSRSARSAQEW